VPVIAVSNNDDGSVAERLSRHIISTDRCGRSLHGVVQGGHLLVVSHGPPTACSPASEVIAAARECSTKRRSQSNLSASMSASPVESAITDPFEPLQYTEIYSRRLVSVFTRKIP
jgi:hypothetical protein